MTILAHMLPAKSDSDDTRAFLKRLEKKKKNTLGAVKDKEVSEYLFLLTVCSSGMYCIRTVDTVYYLLIVLIVLQFLFISCTVISETVSVQSTKAV